MGIQCKILNVGNISYLAIAIKYISVDVDQNCVKVIIIYAVNRTDINREEEAYE